jgi:multisubunit Na+/H+ antiporter MnhF subunit
MTEVLYLAARLVMLASVSITLVRFWRGPGIFDRALAVDALALAVVGYLLLQSHDSIGRFYTDAALGLALFSFVGTVVAGHFLGRGEYPDE